MSNVTIKILPFSTASNNSNSLKQSSDTVKISTRYRDNKSQDTRVGTACVGAASPTGRQTHSKCQPPTDVFP